MTAGAVKKNFPSFLTCIGKRKKEECYHGSEVGTIHSGETATAKGQFL